MANINVLMCGGRRTGKTSIISAMNRSMLEKFANASIALQVEQSAYLQKYTNNQQALFGTDHMDDDYYFADDQPTSEMDTFRSKVTFSDKRSALGLTFTDIPGEWFVDAAFEDKVIQLIRDNQILIIAVDTPHLIEENGKYHEVFNRPEKITSLIKKALGGGDDKARMVLFVPVKIEKYASNKIIGFHMNDIFDKVKAGYSDLITYLTKSYTGQCTVAVAPCITMGGMEFVNFVPIKDKNGNKLPDLSINGRTGLLEFNHRSRYAYLDDPVTEIHFYAPKNCEQPLLYVLLFLIALDLKRNKNMGPLGAILNSIFGNAGSTVLNQSKALIDAQTIRDKNRGYGIIDDPIGIL